MISNTAIIGATLCIASEAFLLFGVPHMDAAQRRIGIWVSQRRDIRASRRLTLPAPSITVSVARLRFPRMPKPPLLLGLKQQRQG